jgi:hypothetical protein
MYLRGTRFDSLNQSFLGLSDEFRHSALKHATSSITKFLPAHSYHCVSASRPCRFTPRERAPGTHWIGGWVVPRAGLDDEERINFLTLPGLELQPLCRPARSQSLYRLSYPGSAGLCSTFIIFGDDAWKVTVSAIYIHFVHFVQIKLNL